MEGARRRRCAGSWPPTRRDGGEPERSAAQARKLAPDARAKLVFRRVFDVGRGGELLEQLELLGARNGPARGSLDALHGPLQPTTLLEQMIELRVATGNRRGVIPDLVVKRALDASQMIADFAQQCLQRGESGVAVGSLRGRSNAHL